MAIIEWVTSLGDRRIKINTIRGYLAGVRSWHVDMGHQDLDIFQDQRLKRIFKGIRRFRGEADLRERKPLIRGLLLRILPSFNVRTLYGATMHAAFCLAFTAFLRTGELTWD